MKYKDQGYIMQLQNFSVNDGEGIRTNVFMSGCPLKCIWCCNPEHKFYMDEAHLMTVDQVVKKVGEMALFFRRGGGGVTFSGGEATLQQGFLRSMTEAFYDKGYNLAIETCGAFVFEEVEDILKKMDLIFYDLKVMDPALHKLFTGFDGQIIQENLKKVAGLGIPLVVRIPVIIGINAWEVNIRETCQFLQTYAPSAGLEFLPYHQFGMDKYTSLGIPGPEEQYENCKGQLEESIPGFFWTENLKTPSDEMLFTYTELAESYGIEVVSYR